MWILRNDTIDVKTSDKTEVELALSWYSKKAFWILINIPWGQKALVTGFWGKQREIDGPKSVLSLNDIRAFERIEIEPWKKVSIYKPWEKNPKDVFGPWIEFRHPDGISIEHKRYIVDDGAKWWLFNEKWEHIEIEWPKVIHIHPEWTFIPFKKIQLSEREAVVVIGKDGKERIIKGEEQSEIFYNPVIESLKIFKWTGSWENGPDSEKVPWSLRFDVLRLDNSQTYFSFPVRTKDNAVIIIKLMIFYEISDLEKIVKETHDPLSEFYNKIQAAVTEKISEVTFDEFKEKTGEQIGNIDFFKNKPFENIGMKIDRVVLREWEPEDRDVQRVLERAAMVQTEKTLDEANHDRNMKKLLYQKLELEEARKSDALREKLSIKEWKNEWKKLASMLDEIKKSTSPEEAVNIIKLHLWASANVLNIGSDLLK